MNQRAVTIHDMYDHHTMLIMRIILKPDSSCIDVGAHVGSVLAEIIKICPKGRHFAFEPIPHLFESLRREFPSVNIYDYACSDEEGVSTFFHVKNDPAYSGLKKRRYDRPDPEISEISVNKMRLDKIIPPEQKIDFIKIDVEGGDLPVLRGAKRIIVENKPLIIFESGLGASDYYGTTGEKIFDYLVDECGLEINTLDGLLRGMPCLTKEALAYEFNTVSHYYFVATRLLTNEERISNYRGYLLDIDKRLFAIENKNSKELKPASHADNKNSQNKSGWRGFFKWREVGGSRRNDIDLNIDSWGPHSMLLDNIPNMQPDGRLGIWINTANGKQLGDDVQVLFSDCIVLASVQENLITAAIPTEQLVRPGNMQIAIKQVSTGKIFPVGTFVIRDVEQIVAINDHPKLNPILLVDNADPITSSIRSQRTLIEREAENISNLSEDNDSIGRLRACCYLCGLVDMTFSRKYGWHDSTTGQFVINWREHLVCPECGLNNRMRATIHILDTYCAIEKLAPVYITEQNSRLFSAIREFLYPNLIGSEFLGDICPHGQVHNEIRNEDMTQLSFVDNKLAAVLSFDVLEHIPNYLKAIEEVYRCLVSGGSFVFSVPFDICSDKTLLRAEICADGSLKYNLPPEYHGDPVNPDKGILCFQTFGWDLLKTLQKVGFHDVKVIDYWSRDYGYLGGCLIFLAKKP